MKFKEWLDNIQEVANRQKSAGMSDQSSLTGLTGRFGHSMTQLPLSTNLDNAAITGFAGGIGSAVSRNLRRMGHEFSPTSRIEEPPWRQTAPYILHGTLPLQLPIVEGKPVGVIGRNFSYSKSGVKSLRGLIPEPAPKNASIINLGSSAPGQFQLYVPNQSGGEQNPFMTYQMAVNFTQALIHILIRDKILFDPNTRDKVDEDSMKMESSQVDDQNNKITCVFSFKKKNTSAATNNDGD